MGRVKPVCGIITKGLKSDSEEEYVSVYVIKTSLDGQVFELLRNRNGEERVFEGNHDGYNSQENRFDPVYARHVRLQIKKSTSRPAVKWDVLHASKSIVQN